MSHRTKLGGVGIAAMTAATAVIFTAQPAQAATVDRKVTGVAALRATW
ncbi:hypothetical protein [Actinomadura rudentiformis]|nr:hypothetical protein [Actinomadura rudentiformis]